MRVYNGTNSQLDLPLSGSQRITIPSHSVSGNIMPSSEFLKLLVSSYDYSEVALIISGPFEFNLCAEVSGSVGFVVQSLEEAIERFAIKEDKKEEPVVVENTASESQPEILQPDTKADEETNPASEIKVEEEKVDVIEAEDNNEEKEENREDVATKIKKLKKLRVKKAETEEN